MRTIDQIVAEIFEYKAKNYSFPDVLKITREEYNELYRLYSIGTEFAGTDPPKDITGSKFFGIRLELL